MKSEPPNYGLDPKRVEVMLNPTVAGAMQFWRWDRLGKPLHPDVVLAGIHKARCVWPGSTPAMIEESRLWLWRHGFRVPEGRI